MPKISVKFRWDHP